MARDYSTRGNNRGKSGAKPGKRTSAPAKSRRSAPKSRAPKKNTRKKNSGTPKWVWVGCLLFFAMAAGAVGWIASRPTGHPGRDFSKVEVPQPDKTADAAQTSAESSPQKPQQPKFAFYEMLPDYEVVIPGEMDKIRQRSKTEDHDSSASTQQQTDTESGATHNADTSKNYIIQVGAFSNSKDANQLRARVTLLGLQAKVVRSESQSGQTIYRVRSDVINSDSRLTEMVKRLHDENIETLVLRRSK